MTAPLRRRALAEAVGTGLLLYVVVGSGIAVEQLGTEPLGQLFAHAVIVGTGLAAIIWLFAGVSGSHFNPVVSIAFWRRRVIDTTELLAYVGAQILGAVAGVMVANLGFGLAAVDLATNPRPGAGRVVSEAIGTFVLVLLILLLVQDGRPSAIPGAVGAWVATIILATPSTGFANPAVAIARQLSDTYTGIAPAAVPGFVAAQLAAGLLAVAAAHYFAPIVHQPTTEEVTR